MFVRHALAPLLVAVLTWPSPHRAQQPSFVARTALVQVDVVALDRDRRPILDLTQADFTVLEDGKPRPIVAFTRVDLPSAASMPAPAAAAASDALAAEGGMAESPPWPEEGRLVIILFDRSIPTAAVPAARVIASTVVDSLGPTDLAAVVRTSQFANDGLWQDFTADRERLRRTIASPYMGLTVPPAMSPDGLMGGSPRQTGAECWCNVCVPDIMSSVAETIRDVQRLRKVLVFIGSDMPAFGDAAIRSGMCRRAIEDSRSRLLRQIDAANITVHSFDPSGLTTDTVPAGGLRGFGPDQQRAYGMDRRQTLGALPERTGGRIVVNTNTPEADVRTALDESRTYYLLGFQPANPVADGRYHRIDVKVSRRVSTLRWRRGYYAR